MSQNHLQPERQAHLTTSLPRRLLSQAQAWWELRGLDFLFYCYLMATVGLFFFSVAHLVQRNS
jgi:hypothetical protein